jgi:uncharacterized protein
MYVPRRSISRHAALRTGVAAASSLAVPSALLAKSRNPRRLGLRRIKFENRGIPIIGNLHLPADFDGGLSWPALVLTTPGSSVKEQIGGVYASRMAERGFVALTFDPSYQGESGGKPRDREDPAVRVEDIKCALDFLMTQDFIDQERVGLLALCAGGGYGVNAALTEHRFKAIGTVVANDLGTAFRGFQTKPQLLETIAEVGRQRTAEARGAPVRRDPWIPDSMAEAVAQGIEDQATIEAVAFYRESEYRHPNSTNRLLFTSNSQILAFDAFSLVPDLLIQPLQVIVGGRRGSTGQYEAGERLFNLSPSKDKAFFVVDGAGHYDLYYKPEYVGPAVDVLAPFFERHLAAGN